jgi:peptide/nickel transport system substrate-binding protein
LWSRDLAVFAACVWLAALLSWLVARSDGLGGRPLVIIWSDDPEVYDPHATSHPVAQAIFQHVCEPLFYEDFDGTLRGLLAEDQIAYADAGRRLTIHVRPGISFHDGLPLDAAAVAASFGRLRRQGASPLLNDLRDVRVAAQADARTVVFHLPTPDYEFARLVLSNSYAAIVSPQAGDPKAPGLVACTGPYRFVPELYRPGQALTLAHVPGYGWPPRYLANRGAATIPQLRFVFEAERSARLDRLLAGEACVLSLSQEQTAALTTRSEFRLYADTGGVTYLGFNFQQPRWRDLRVRQAVAHALDKHALAESGPFLVADTPLAPDATGYTPQAAAFGYNYAPDRSRSLLVEAGFDGDHEVVLLIPESHTYRQLATVVRQQLKAVGISQIRVRAVSRADILTTRQDFDLLLFDYAWENYTALSVFLGPGPRNLLGYPQTDVVALVTQARATVDAIQRRQLVLDAQRMVFARALWQPLLIRRIMTAVDGRCVQGERQSPGQGLLFHDAVTALAWR